MGKLVERMYQDASFCEMKARHSFLETLRRSIGYPFSDSSPIQCVVCSENGFDLGTFGERAAVASILWRNGISCEFSAQSGVMMSLLACLTSKWEWNVEMLLGICAIMNIPFVVVVVPHLFRSKHAVKVRAATMHSSSGEVYNYAGSEDFVPLSSLATYLLERLKSLKDENDDVDGSLQHLASSTADAISTVQMQSHHANVDCIYVEADQYFDNEHKVSKSDSSQWKQVRKNMKSVSSKMINHINKVFDPSTGNGQSIPVVAVDLPFQVVREVGSSVMFNGISSLNSNDVNGKDMGSKYPQHKKTLRTLSFAMDTVCRRYKKEVSLFLYSVPCDKYDLITITL